VLEEALRVVRDKTASPSVKIQGLQLLAQNKVEPASVRPSDLRMIMKEVLAELLADPARCEIAWDPDPELPDQPTQEPIAEEKGVPEVLPIERVRLQFDRARPEARRLPDFRQREF
jgi:hypothetical protein